ncbi:MAG TPA: HNH endonuclease [Pyrinomonadaceae bacterium]|jgi:5-methylcytosine-specific restriction protein A|nr:HNH endonuclease [Pyrinomonadaceae bacterium]
MMEIPFEIGKIYDRSRDIHSRFGGQGQGGISTPRNAPYIFLFTGESGEQYGYRDDWNEDGVFLYTGEGQVGDMTFVRGNKAIRDHLTNGKELLMFKNHGSGTKNEFLGAFACVSWEMRTAPDKYGDQRRVIVFHLVSQDDRDGNISLATTSTRQSLGELRRRAYAASSTPAEKDLRQTLRRYYERSEEVRAYVLARAAGTCESCGKPAPFKRLDGLPYLEPHHTRRVSDGGLDHPRWVAGICPNCHKEIHYGMSGIEINRRLQEYLALIEQD